MMAHENYRQMMSLALDGLLPPADEAVLERHLDECATCTAVWEAMSSLDVLLGRAEMVSPPPDFSARVMARVEARRTGRRWTETVFWLAMMALLVAVVFSQWASPVAASASLPVLSGPLGELAERAEPVLAAVRTVGAVLGVLGEALALWLTYMASLPVVWAAGLTTLALAATLVGLIGVLEPGQPGLATRDAVRVS
jgi:anti-sigma factor RsiW